MTVNVRVGVFYDSREGGTAGRIEWTQPMLQANSSEGTIVCMMCINYQEQEGRHSDFDHVINITQLQWQGNGDG
jgi:hypothetical protein